MVTHKRFWLILLIVVFSATTFIFTTQTFAQDAQLSILDVDVSQIPTVQMTILGNGSNNTPLNLDGQFIGVEHDGNLVENASVVGRKDIGTLTVFLIDLTSGITDELPAIQSTIETFASAPNMQEQVDVVAIYRVDEVASIEILPPTTFYNDVRNLFASELETTNAPTALINSMGNLINQMPNLRPDPAMAMSLVVMSDGTDSVSTQFLPDDIPTLANANNITINTIWLRNENLNFSVEAGQEYLRQVAERTGGISTSLEDESQINNMWSQIASRRSLLVIGYTLETVLPGTFPVKLSLPDTPGAPAATSSVTIPDSIPSVTIDLAEEDRTLSLESIEEPVELAFPVTVRWLDEQVRTVGSAQLFVNGNNVAEIPPTEMTEVRAEVPLQYGENTVQIRIQDELGQNAHGTVTLTVNEGGNEIPAGLGDGRDWLRTLLVALMLIALVAILLLIFRIGSQRLQAAGGIAGIRENFQREEKPESTSAGDSTPIITPLSEAPLPELSAETQLSPALESTQPNIRPGTPTIEVLDSISKMTTRNPISRTEFLIGRSPTVDLSFADDPTVSRIHATIVQDGDIYRIYDEQSTSGTYVNDRQVPEYGLQLADGDEIHLGAVHLRFRL